MTKEQLMDLTVACQTFPEMPRPLISHDNILDTTDSIFDENVQLIVVEGGEGIGKTTLLAQFAKRYPDFAFSLFIRPTSRLAFDPAFLRLDLCNQLQWLLHREELHTIEGIDDAFLRNRLFELQRRAKHDRYYFVVDGLDDIPTENLQIRQLIIDMLPLGFTGFRFLVSGDLDRLSPHIPQGIRFKSYPLSRFSLELNFRQTGGVPTGVGQPIAH